MDSEILSFSVVGARIALGLLLLVGCSTQSSGSSVGGLHQTADDAASTTDGNVLTDASRHSVVLDGELPSASDGGNLCGGVACLSGEHLDVAACRCVPDTSPSDGGNLCGGVACLSGEHLDVAACRCVADTYPQGVSRDGSAETKLPGANGAGNVCGGVACLAGEHFDVGTCRCVLDSVLDGAIHP